MNEPPLLSEGEVLWAWQFWLHYIISFVSVRFIALYENWSFYFYSHPPLYCLAFRVADCQWLYLRIPRSEALKKSYLQKQKFHSTINISFSYPSIHFFPPHHPVFRSFLCSDEPTIVLLCLFLNHDHRDVILCSTWQRTTSSTRLPSRPTPAPSSSSSEPAARRALLFRACRSSRAHRPRRCVTRLVPPTRRERSDMWGISHHSFFSRGAFIQKMRKSV